MRNWITLIESGQMLPDAFLSALRKWGDNTVIDQQQKQQNLLNFESYAKNFRVQHEWLYRGQVIDRDQLKALRRNQPIEIYLPLLSSWTTDSDTAHIFAKFNGEAKDSIVIMKRGLVSFFDFEMLGRYLEDSNIEIKEDEYDLRDPIREKEVIVRNDELLIVNKKDVMEFFYFDASGN